MYQLSLFHAPRAKFVVRSAESLELGAKGIDARARGDEVCFSSFHEAHNYARAIARGGYKPVVQPVKE